MGVQNPSWDALVHSKSKLWGVRAEAARRPRNSIAFPDSGRDIPAQILHFEITTRPSRLNSRRRNSPWPEGFTSNSEPLHADTG